MEEEIKSYASNEIGESSRNYHNPPSMPKINGNNPHVEYQDDDDLGPLPMNWEKAYTENGEVYFIDHTTGQSHWLDPRLRKFQKKSLEDCEDDELPYGWEKIVDPEYGIYYIDHVNRRTQYENPVIQAKRALDIRHRLESATSSNFMPENDLPIEPMEPKNFFTKNPAELLGERIQTTLVKSQRGLGFTVIGGDCNDENIDEFLQIKSIVANSPAALDGKLKTGDILVFVNHICVLGFTHHEMVNIFQSIMPGEEVHLDVCRGYKLPFDPSDPNTEIVTTIAVNGLNDEVEKNRLFLDILNDNYNFLEMSNEPDNLSYGKNQSMASVKSSFEVPEIHDIIIVKGDQGFGFTIAESNLWGQKVKKILDRQCCKDLMEGDILLSINNINIKNLTHTEVVQVLKDCPKNQETVLRVQRGLIRSSLNKFNGKARGKIDGANKISPGTAGDKLSMTNGLYRSKTPTADIYSTQQKETLPIRPKTPLVDTRTRVQMKTPIQLNDLNTDDIELDSKLTDHDDNKSTISTATTAYDTTKLLTEQFDNFAINDQRSDTYTTTDSITSKTSGNGGRNRFFSPVDIKNGNGDYYYANSNHSYSLPPPPSIPISSSTSSQGRYIQPIQPIQPLQNPSTISYQHQPHDNCFCYDCQDYRLKQNQHSEYVSSSNNTSDYSLLQNQFNLPPQMSDNIGQRINNYLMDRKRNAGDVFSSYHPYRPNGNIVDDFYYVEVTLERQAMGYMNSDGTQARGTFGFRIVGGTEEGTQICVGYIVKDGPADRDPRIQTGDEIVNINGVNVECASHHLVVKLMNDAALLGQVTMLLRKRKPQNMNTFYRPQNSYENQVIPNTYDVIINRQEHEGFGFVIISSSNQSSGSTIGKIIPNSPADNGQLKIGDRIIRVNDIDISSMSHGDVVKIIKESGLTVQLTVSNCTQARATDFISEMIDTLDVI
ncbi:hypothetical protein ACKWTF_010761 [Chironomus riparius]